VFDTSVWHSSVVSKFESSSGFNRYQFEDKKYGGRLIPLCTPVTIECDALVIGTNHSDFIDGGGAVSEGIAQGFAAGNKEQRHTLLDDNHKFARNLRSLCARAGHPVTKTWVSTNRSPVQGGPVGARAFQGAAWYKELETFMDQMLLQLIGELRPKNVILCGNYAARLLYGSRAEISKIRPRLIELNYSNKKGGSIGSFMVNAIPVWHPSRVRYSYAEIIENAWQS
jgi:hypothetical protein